MKNIYNLTLLFFLINFGAHAQLNLGLGVGHQYMGVPGARVGYYYKAIEPSANIGFYRDNNQLYMSYGLGMSVYYHYLENVNFRKKISYGFDMSNHPQYGFFVGHSLVANIEFYTRIITPLQLRLGFGARHALGEFFPTASIGLFMDLEDIKSMGIHFHFQNKFGK